MAAAGDEPDVGPGAAPAGQPAGRRDRGLGRLTVVVLVVGLVATGLLAWLTWWINDGNESRLLRLQVQEGVTALGGVLPGIQTPLASAGELAKATGDPAEFQQYMARYVGKDRPFVYASLWRVTGAGPPQRLVTVGRVPGRAGGAPSTASGRRFIQQAAASPQLAVSGHLGGRYPRVGYAYPTAGGTPKYVAFAENLASPTRRVQLSGQTGFTDLDFALYLGRREDAGALIATTVRHLPITGRTATATVPFGDTVLTVVATPAGQLGGTLLEALPWIVVGGGVVLSVVAAVLTEWLVRRRKVAESLAEENRRLYGQQHSIAETLQRALLPEELPTIAGFDVDARYLAGVEAMDIGGDWYDVIPDDGGGFLFVVGDVSGRGLRAATVMASLRYAIRAYAAEGDQPEVILAKLGTLLRVEVDGHFATVLCGRVAADGSMTLANAGHLPPVLARDDGAAFVPVEVGVPVGVSTTAVYRPSQTPLPASGTLLAFTDGLVERRGEDIGTGLERLRQAAAATAGAVGPLGDALDRMVGGLLEGGSDDDTALLGLRWPG